MPLQAIPYEISRYSVSHLFSVSGWDQWDWDPPYQRDYVWTLEQRRKLIASLLENLPLPPLMLNRRIEGSEAVLVDGKQRLETLRMWRDSEFTVPAHWFADVDTEAGENPALEPGVDVVEWITRSQLTDHGRALLERRMLTFHETQLSAVMEVDLYLRYNRGGTEHTDGEIQQASEVLDLRRDEAADNAAGSPPERSPGGEDPPLAREAFDTPRGETLTVGGEDGDSLDRGALRQVLAEALGVYPGAADERLFFEQYPELVKVLRNVRYKHDKELIGNWASMLLVGDLLPQPGFFAPADATDSFWTRIDAAAARRGWVSVKPPAYEGRDAA